jgi:uncharacterized alkaline shock family protein YloU
MLQNGGEEQFMSEDSILGKIIVAPRAIASIASEAVLSCYGVVGMSAATLRDGIAEVLQVGNLHRGVQVNMVDERIVIDLYVVVEYGTRVSEVARNVAENVRFRVEKALTLPVAEVNVHVQGLRVSNDD